MELFKILLIIFIFCSFPCPSIQSDSETYIVHVESPKNQISIDQLSMTDLDNYYLSFLPKSTTAISSIGNEVPASMIYSYHNVMKGFAAILTASQVKEMEKKPGFVSAQKQSILSLQTTHSPSFLGLQPNMGLWKNSHYGKGVIIGVIDSGILPDHPSFSDVGMPPPPAKWKGVCEPNFKCNNKLIGARSFPQLDNNSQIDETRHGTHTASTAVGAFVKGANVYGNANGTAVGVAPLAHIAMYKLCNDGRCDESDILAAMDVAIDDGVDILSMSLGDEDLRPFHNDTVAIGAYRAMERGILVSCAAGNAGPSRSSVRNTAPWILTVGASTVDRKIKVTVKLGNREEFEGESIYSPKISILRFFTLFNAGKNCEPGSLTDPALRGKIVICQAGGGAPNVGKGQAVKDIGGVGMIVINKKEDGVTKSADVHVLPALDVSATDGSKILA
ncbi:hypothetical protein P3L10_000483 [Capsicum annuum]